MAMATRQAPIVTRPTTSSYMPSLLFFIVTVATVIMSSPALAGHSFPPSTVVLYGFQYNFPPDATIVKVASPSGNLSAFEFGTTFVIADILRETEAADSPLAGQIAGLLAIEKDFSVYSSLTYVLNTTSFSGSISAQGVLNQDGSGEQAITGGTYDFRWARGYVDISLVSPDTEIVARLKIVFHIEYD